MRRTDCEQYLRTFHEKRAGITEEVCGHAFAGAVSSPHAWANRAVVGRVVLVITGG